MALAFPHPHLMWGQNRILRPSAVAASDWWLAGGSIDAGDVIEHVENLSAETALTGGVSVGADFSAAMRVTIDTSFASEFFFLQSDVDYSDRVGIRHRTNDTINAQTSVGGIGTATLSDATTYNLHAVYSSGVFELFLDGVSQGSVANTLQLNTSGAWMIGGGYTYNLIYGALYSLALDSTQIAASHASMSA